MRLVDARNHRQGDGDQRPRLTAVLGAASRTRSGTAPTSPLGGRSAAKGSTNQQGESAPHWIKVRFGAPLRGVRLLLATPGTYTVLRPRHCGRRNRPYLQSHVHKVSSLTRQDRSEPLHY